MEKDFRLANYFISYVAMLLFLGVGAITTLGLEWYKTIMLPAWMPSTMLVAVVWAALFILTSLSASIVWDRAEGDPAVRTTITLYTGNALLILLWNYLFFGVHMLFAASAVALIVGLSVLVLMVRVSKVSMRATWLLMPYLIWMLLALYLNYIIWTLNP